MRIGSLFSGIGGLELGLEWAELGSVAWQVEINPFARRILAKHWPNVKRFEDVHHVGSHNLDPVDLICGGFPCQDVSSAGKRVGLDGARSGLWYEFRRIVEELAPPFVIVENVASGRERWLPFVRRDLHLRGYGSRAFLLSAEDVGAPHRRRRIFVVARRKVANARDDGRERSGEAHDGGRGRCDESGNVAHRRDPITRFPPRPLEWDEQATTDYQPWFLGGSPRIPDRVDRFIALGNCVMPQQAQAIGLFVKDLARGEFSS